MTIAMCVSVPGGFVLGSESRQIVAGEKMLESISKCDYTDRNFEVCEGEYPKVYPIGKFGLCYSGAGFAGKWIFEADVMQLQEMANSNKYSFRQLAEHFTNKLTQALGSIDNLQYIFYFAGYEDGYPILARCSNGQLSFQGGKNQDPAYTMYIAGMVDVLRKLFTDEVVDYGKMTLKQAIEFTYLTIVTGSKYLEYFEKYPEVSGGAVNIMVIRPNKSETFRFPAFGLSIGMGELT